MDLKIPFEMRKDIKKACFYSQEGLAKSVLTIIIEAPPSNQTSNQGFIQTPVQSITSQLKISYTAYNNKQGLC